MIGQTVLHVRVLNGLLKLSVWDLYPCMAIGGSGQDPTSPSAYPGHPLPPE